VVEYKILIKAYVAAKMVAIEPSSERAHLRRRIAGMVTEPQPPDARALPGYADRFRLRLGMHMIAYRIDRARKEVTIVAVRARRRHHPSAHSPGFDALESLADTAPNDF
jgi:mRNA-degrading endonuclease RelE of RelBE toxin-antitoxin system